MPTPVPYVQQLKVLVEIQYFNCLTLYVLLAKYNDLNVPERDNRFVACTGHENQMETYDHICQMQILMSILYIKFV